MIESIRDWFRPAPDSLVASNVRKGKSPWTDAVHLLWSFWIFATPIFDHWTWTWTIITLTSYPVFLVLYAKCCVASRRTVIHYALALTAFSMALMPWYPSGLTYFVFGCVMLVSCSRSVKQNLKLLALVNAACLSEAWLLHYPWQAFCSIPITTFVICLIINAERISDEKEAELQLSHDEVRRLAATAERERIGRDLHDLLGHTLSLITLKLELSRKLFDRDVEAAKREVAEAEKVARLALAEVRSAVTGIRATDLAAELASARLLLESSRVQFHYEAPPIDLPPEVERGLSLILREAATNIARHAEASIAKIELIREPACVRMLISDNGRGGIDHDGNGLCGMRERVRALGGSLAVESPKGHGTVLKIAAPVPLLRLVETSRLPLSGTDKTSIAHVSGPAA
jgi:two-component system sensor histidine kinase DesK